MRAARGRTAVGDGSASDALAFERAARLRDPLRAIERTVERQEVHAYAGDDLDVLGVAVDGGDAAVQICRVRDGKIVGRDHFFLDGSEGATPGEVVASFLRQYYSWATPSAADGDGHAASSPIPPEIVTLVEVAEAQDLVAFAEKRCGGPVRLLVPQRGRNRRLAELAMRNAEDALRQERVRWLADRGKTQEALQELYGALRDHLDIEGPPKRIECYDVSHVQGTDVVPGSSLLRRFGSVRGIREAPTEEVAAVSAVGRALARRIKPRFYDCPSGASDP